jgi:hypothetical protein
MFLLTDAVGFAEPRENFADELLCRVDAEIMDLVARGDALHVRETGISQAVCQNYVGIEPVLFDINSANANGNWKPVRVLIGTKITGPHRLTSCTNIRYSRSARRLLPRQIVAHRGTEA